MNDAPARNASRLSGRTVVLYLVAFIASATIALMIYHFTHPNRFQRPPAPAGEVDGGATAPASGAPNTAR